MMEHRLSRRFAIDHPVEIFHGRRRVVRGRMRNVSKEGALLVADDGPSRHDSHVELELCNANNDTSPRRLPGVVVHSDDEKIGVLLLERWSEAEWDLLTESVATGSTAL